MASAATICLSRNDSAVLGALFDPEAALRAPNSSDPTLPEPYGYAVLSEVKEQERSALLLIDEENPAIRTIQSAIDKLSQIIATYPEYASAWNNRAQATRMLFDLADFQRHAAKIRRIYSDLSKAIELARPKNSLGIVSGSSAKVLSSAHTHRGYLLWRASRPEAAIEMLDAVRELRGLGKDQLEELASKDFSQGGRYGNQTAQQLAIKTNPYAKLCGSIVREAMQKEIEEFHQKPG